MESQDVALLHRLEMRGVKLTVRHARRTRYATSEHPAGEPLEYELSAEEALQVANLGLEAFWWRKLMAMPPDELREFLGFKPDESSKEQLIANALEVLHW